MSGTLPEQSNAEPLPPKVRRAFESATKHADDVLAVALGPVHELGIDTANLTLEQVRYAVTEKLHEHRAAEAAVRRRLVVDDTAAQVLVDAMSIPVLAARFRLVADHVEPARQYARAVREALAVVMSRELIDAEGAARIGEGVGLVEGRSPRIVVVSPLHDPRQLLEIAQPGLQQWAQENGVPIDGVPIEYWRVQIDEQGELQRERMTGEPAPEQESGLRYYTDPDAIAWMNDLVDERSFAEKLAATSHEDGRRPLGRQIGGKGPCDQIRHRPTGGREDGRDRCGSRCRGIDVPGPAGSGSARSGSGAGR